LSKAKQKRGFCLGKDLVEEEFVLVKGEKNYSSKKESSQKGEKQEKTPPPKEKKNPEKGKNLNLKPLFFGGGFDVGF